MNVIEALRLCKTLRNQIDGHEYTIDYDKKNDEFIIKYSGKLVRKINLSEVESVIKKNFIKHYLSALIHTLVITTVLEKDNKK